MAGYLRSAFGFAFLRPRSLFFALSWAFILYTAHAWIDGAVWQEQRAVLLFGVGAMMLYWFHLAFAREWRQTGTHEHHAGTSHVARLPRQGEVSARAMENVHLWIEPGIVLLAAIFLRLSGVRFLPSWLFVVAVCLWSKEVLNHWFRVRYSKRRQDAFEDTEEGIQASVATNLTDEPPQISRRRRLARTRHNSNKKP